MLHGRHDAFFILEGRVTLEAAHRRNAETRNQPGILAIGLLYAAPAGFAGHVHHRGERLMGASRACLPGGHGKKFLHQCGIECRPEGDGLGKTRALARGVSVQTLLVENHRDAQAGVFEKKFLDRIGQPRHAARGLAKGRAVGGRAGIAGPAHLADGPAVPECRLGLGEVEAAMFIDEGLGLVLPDAPHLLGLFSQGHARQQIFDAFFRRQGRILIGGQGGLFCGGRTGTG